jgi:hypothetical protein
MTSFLSSAGTTIKEPSALILFSLLERMTSRRWRRSSIRVSNLLSIEGRKVTRDVPLGPSPRSEFHPHCDLNNPQNAPVFYELLLLNGEVKCDPLLRVTLHLNH